MNNQSNYINFHIWKSNASAKLKRITIAAHDVENKQYRILNKYLRKHPENDYIKRRVLRVLYQKQIQYAILMTRIKKIRAYYLYLNRTLIRSYTYGREFQKFIKVGYVTTKRLTSQIDATLHPLLTDEDKKYMQMAKSTLDKYGVVDKNMSLYSYGIFIQLVLKHIFCKDIANYICDFI